MAAVFSRATCMNSFMQSEPKMLPQFPSCSVSFKLLSLRPTNVNEQPAREDDPEDELMVLDVSRNRYLHNSWACGLATFSESDTVPTLSSICQFWVVLFMNVEPVETNAGMLREYVALGCW